MRSLQGLGVFSLMAVAAIVAACSGSDGADGAAGAPGAAGSNGAPGAPGSAGAKGDTGPAGKDGTSSTSDGGTTPAGPSLVFLSERAQRGMQISPVPLSLDNKTQDQLELIGNGSYIVNAQASCSDCHTFDPTKFLAGGYVFPIDAAGHQVVTRNLTPDPATGLKVNEGQLIQAFRNGTDVLNGGSQLIVHPWQSQRWMTTYDIRSIYAYLQVIPAVTNNITDVDNKPLIPALAFPSSYNEGDKQRALPPDVDVDAGPFATPDQNEVLHGLAIIPLDVPTPSDPTMMKLVGRGSYIVNAVVGCSSCHTNPERDFTSPTQKINTAQYMTGGRVFPAPPGVGALVGVTRSASANLIGKANGAFNQPEFDFQAFLSVMESGVHANGSPIVYPMPVSTFKHMTLDDLEAVYAYYAWLADNTNVTGNDDKKIQTTAVYCADDTACNQGGGETCNMATNECIGQVCTTDADCHVCQTCTGSGTKHCAAPDMTSTCPLVGF